MSNEVRDKLAGLEGWTYHLMADPALEGLHRGWEKGRSRLFYGDHPIPDDLTTCAAMWDKYAEDYDWFWEKGNGTWRAYNVNGDGPIGIDETASELRDRWQLLGEVLKARRV